MHNRGNISVAGCLYCQQRIDCLPSFTYILLLTWPGWILSHIAYRTTFDSNGQSKVRRSIDKREGQVRSKDERSDVLRWEASRSWDERLACKEVADDERQAGEKVDPWKLAEKFKARLDLQSALIGRGSDSHLGSDLRAFISFCTILFTTGFAVKAPPFGSDPLSSQL